MRAPTSSVGRWSSSPRGSPSSSPPWRPTSPATRCATPSIRGRELVVDSLLEVRDLSIGFEGRHGRTHAVRGVSFDVAAGELVGVVGESGCGKSVTARALLGLVDAPGQTTEGTIRIDGDDVLTMDARTLRSVRGRRISMVFQDPMTSLNPVFTVGQQLVDVMRAHGHAAPQLRALELLDQVEIPAATLRLRQYPHEL